MPLEDIRRTGLSRPALLSLACLAMQACLLSACLILSRSFAAQDALARSWSAGAFGLTIGAMLTLSTALACVGVALGLFARQSSAGVTALAANAVALLGASAYGIWLFFG